MNGRLVFGADSEPFTGADVYITVEDTTHLDTLASVVAQSKLVGVTSGGPGSSVAFAVDVPRLPGRRLSLRAVVDLDRNGKLSAGDYVNVVAIVVSNDDTSVEVPVRLIR